ncbi:chorismate mutase / prephenate dehydratase [Candidatus Johnevansia muelleri]|uniref:Bifunctional chorismate mutase/prephenate dehydratase n=1 Tax=Candidatus Johnevansia muelleri TaxID=1495769 RepID=A0A078KI70_9GAMM|nr:chorismate mutase / prephenate dehydratase [Candidatus Evansia muelleri]
MKNNYNIDYIRNRIDYIDKLILKLINERAFCAQQVAIIKLYENNNNFYRPEREIQVLRRIININNGPLSDKNIIFIFKDIISMCLALEQPIKVAYLGPKGTFTQEAAIKHFGKSAILKAITYIDDIFKEVKKKTVNYGIIPLENSIEGMINHTLDSLIKSKLKICGEIVLRIHQNFLIGKHTSLNMISRIYSHRQSLEQCRQWIYKKYPLIECIAVDSNAKAAILVKNEWYSAAIAGKMTAYYYNLIIQIENIEDNIDNFTRFIVIGNKEVLPSGNDKTSLIISLRNNIITFYTLIKSFYYCNIDILCIEPRPSYNDIWNYVFFLEFKGHLNDIKIKNFIEIINNFIIEIKILGSYPKN